MKFPVIKKTLAAIIWVAAISNSYAINPESISLIERINPSSLVLKFASFGTYWFTNAWLIISVNKEYYFAVPSWEVYEALPVSLTYYNAMAASIRTGPKGVLEMDVSPSFSSNLVVPYSHSTLPVNLVDTMINLFFFKVVGKFDVKSLLLKIRN